VNLDTVAAYSGKPEVQVDLLGPEVGSCPSLVCIHEIIRVNSQSGSCLGGSTINVVMLVTIITIITCVIVMFL